MNPERALRPISVLAVPILVFLAVVGVALGMARLLTPPRPTAAPPGSSWADRSAALEEHLARQPGDAEARLELARLAAKEEVLRIAQANREPGGGARPGSGSSAGTGHEFSGGAEYDAATLAAELAHSERFAAARATARSVAEGAVDAGLRARAWEALALMNGYSGSSAGKRDGLAAALRAHPCQRHRQLLREFEVKAGFDTSLN